jgi:hypothetical protein
MDRRLGNLTNGRFESDVTDFANLLGTQLRSIVSGSLHLRQPSQRLLPTCQKRRLWTGKRTSTLCGPNHFVCPRRMSFKHTKQQSLISYSSFRMRASRNKPGVTSLCTILASDQLDAQILCFIISLLQSSTCFGRRRAHHQEVKLY